MGLCEGIPSGDHEEWFAIDLDCVAYFGKTALSSSCKIKNKNKTKNEISLGENQKEPSDN